jgi:hypothetical protein
MGQTITVVQKGNKEIYSGKSGPRRMKELAFPSALYCNTNNLSFPFFFLPHQKRHE